MRKAILFCFLLFLGCFALPGAQCQTADAKGGKSSEPIGYAQLKKDIEIADKRTAPFPRLVGNARFPLLGKKKIGNADYYALVLEDVNGFKRPALVPFYDERGNPSVEERVDYVIIDNTVGLKAYLGCYLLKAREKFPVISSSNGKYVVRYTANGCDEKLEVPEADVSFISVQQEKAQRHEAEKEYMKRHDAFQAESQRRNEAFWRLVAEKGLVEYDGNWITPQQAQAIQMQQQTAAWIKRFRNDELSLDELSALLRGKTQEQVISIIGRPNDTVGSLWFYDRRIGYDATTGRHRGITVHWSGEVVESLTWF